MTTPQLFAGLISGTSIDGVDVALVQMGNTGISLISAHTVEYAKNLRQQLLSVATEKNADLDQVLSLHQLVGEIFADAILSLLHNENLEPTQITAIGSHGQTVRHYPNRAPSYSLQLGNPAVIAARTDIITVADFRSMDIALGGQGAPLAPLFHREVFGDGQEKLIVNIGGIANITHLRGTSHKVAGFDTGPGNMLMDAWSQKRFQCPFDRDGLYARQGNILQPLLRKMLDHPYFRQPWPKSTGREEFNLGWLEEQLVSCPSADDHDVMATLCELTARTIADAVHDLQCSANLYLCGGGALNAQLVRRLRTNLLDREVTTTSALGLAPEWVEAAAFAWLAQQRLAGAKLPLPEVTGAKRPAQLGAVYVP